MSSRSERFFAPTEYEGALLPAEVTVEGDLVGGGTALCRMFALHAQVHPLAECDPSAHADAVTARSRQRHSTVGRQQAQPLVRHPPVAEGELYPRRR